MYLIGGVFSSGGALAWVKDLYQIADYTQLKAMALSVDIGTNPLFIAHFHGSSPPFNDSNAKASFVGLEPRHGAANLIRAVYEGVVFEFNRGLDVLETTTHIPVETVRVVGGLNDDFMLKLRASIYGKTLELVKHDDMVTLGAALLAGIGANIYDNPADAIAQTFQLRGSIEPDEAWQEAYQAVFTQYVEAIAT